MIKSEKKLKELEIKLQSASRKVISDSIITLRNEVPFMGVIPALVSLYDTSEDVVIRDLIRNFLNDIKEPEARKEIITEILKIHKPETTSMVVASCWHSGLDYSDYIADFVTVFMKGDYVTALECFTVIEEAVPEITDSARLGVINLLEQNNEKTKGEKKPLLEALKRVLS